LRPARNNCPDRTCPPAVEGRDKGSIVTPGTDQVVSWVNFERHRPPAELGRLFEAA
jgi:hypothetical protein